MTDRPSSYMTSNEMFKLRNEYGIEALKKIGTVEEVQNPENGLIDVFFNGTKYMSFCPSGPSIDSFWIESDIETDPTKYGMLYTTNKDGVQVKNLSRVN